MMQKIKTFFKNPILITISILFILIMVLFIGNHFFETQYYIDKEAALQAMQLDDVSQRTVLANTYKNKMYVFWNSIGEIFSLFFAILIILFCFRIKKFGDFKKLLNINNKTFIFLWINSSFLLYVFAWQNSYMGEIEKFVYNGYHDTMGIPYFSTLINTLLYGFIYYPCVNVLFYIIYNTKISRIIYALPLIYNLKHILGVLLALCVIHFSWTNILLYIYAIIWLFVTIGATKHLLFKNEQPIPSINFIKKIKIK